MTAEIAILNKTAVALATDSAVTISAGQTEAKIFDSGDKLFELCDDNPIGVMIYNNLQFAEIPLPVMIKEFRAHCRSVARVPEAAEQFLKYLNDMGVQSSKRIQDQNMLGIVDPILQRMRDRAQQKILDTIVKLDPSEAATKIAGTVNSVNEEVVGVFERAYQKLPAGDFVDGVPEFSEEHAKAINDLIAQTYPQFIPYAERVITLLKLYLLSDVLSESRTGIVVAGFGNDDIFPTLIAFEIDGMVLGHLKKRQVRLCDIDRDGERAAVIPFAQKEMVDRFLYGLDDQIEREISSFASKTVSTIGTTVADTLTFETDAERENFRQNFEAAEKAFVTGLKTGAFQAIREKEQAAIQDIVEFMPKPEIAKMAEALVELTSIKRRVSRGMETVREPIDVAVISRAKVLFG